MGAITTWQLAGTFKQDNIIEMWGKKEDAGDLQEDYHVRALFRNFPGNLNLRLRQRQDSPCTAQLSSHTVRPCPQATVAWTHSESSALMSLSGVGRGPKPSPSQHR